MLLTSASGLPFVGEMQRCLCFAQDSRHTARLHFNDFPLCVCFDKSMCIGLGEKRQNILHVSWAILSDFEACKDPCLRRQCQLQFPAQLPVQLSACGHRWIWIWELCGIFIVFFFLKMWGRCTTQLGRRVIRQPVRCLVWSPSLTSYVTCMTVN